MLDTPLFGVAASALDLRSEVRLFVGSISRPRLAAVALALSVVIVACGHRVAPRAPGAVTPHHARDVATSSPEATTISSAQALMVEAMAGMRAGHAAETVALWRRALVEYPKLRDYHLYYLGLAEASAGRVDEARRTLDTLLREEKDSVLRPYAAFRLGSLLARADPRAAIVRLRVARADLPKGSGEWAKASLILSRLELQEGHTGTAWRLLGDIRRRVGVGIARRRARRAARRLAVLSPATARRAPRVAEEARLLLREGAAVEARRLLLNALESDPPSRFRPGLLSLLATAQHEAGLLEAAEATIESLVTDHSSHVLAPGGLLLSARWRWNRDDDDVALERFTRFMQRYPRHGDVPEALHAIGRIHEAAGRFAAARRAYNDLERRFPKARLVGDARWHQGWLEYVQRRYGAAAASFGRLASSAGRTPVRARALYWQARAVERGEGVGAAWPSMIAVLVEAPYSYYAVWAEQWVAERAMGAEPVAASVGAGSGGADQAREMVPRRGPVLSARRSTPRALALLAGEPGASTLDPLHFGRAVDLAGMALARHAERELDAIRFPRAAQTEARLVLLEAYARVGAHHRALGLARLTPALMPGALGPLDRFRYPLGYWELIREHATSRGVDPFLVTAVIRQESAFDPQAVSPKGARGLMQLMPETAEAVAARLGLAAPATRDLDRPAVNVRLGTAYLARLLDAYGGVVHRALAAYNAGVDAVEKWDRRFPDAAPDEFVEQISYPETRGYVKLVMRNHRVYRLLYGETDPAPGLMGRGWSESALRE